MELKTTQAQLARYFSAWLNWWIKINKYTQLRAAIKLEVTPGFINMIINNKRAASATQMEKIAQAVSLDLLDVLAHGRNILTGESVSKSSEVNFWETGLEPTQIDSVREYRALLLTGGEGVEVITASIHALTLNRGTPNLREKRDLKTFPK